MARPPTTPVIQPHERHRFNRCCVETTNTSKTTHTMETQTGTTKQALSWLRETDTLTIKTLELAVTQDLQATRNPGGTISVSNHSHDNPTDHEYTVMEAGGIISTCSCPQFHYRSVVCKHMVHAAICLERGEL